MKKILCFLLIIMLCMPFASCAKKDYKGFIWYQTGKDDPDLLYDAIYNSTKTDIPNDATMKILHDTITESGEGFALVEVDYSTSKTSPADMTMQISMVDGWEGASTNSDAYNRIKEAFDYLGLALPSFENAFTYYNAEIYSDEVDEEVASYVGFWSESSMKYYVLCMLTLEAAETEQN